MDNRIGKSFTENSQTTFARYVSDAQGNAYYLKNGSNAPQPTLNALFGVTPELSELNIDFTTYSTICGFSVDFEDSHTALINWTNPSPSTSYFCFCTYTKQPETGKADYRYGFNGQERSDEVYGKGNLNTALFWEYDTRLGRRWNLDPIIKEYESPYATFANNPIWFIDILGSDTCNVDCNGNSETIAFGGDDFEITTSLSSLDRTPEIVANSIETETRLNDAANILNDYNQKVLETDANQESWNDWGAVGNISFYSEQWLSDAGYAAKSSGEYTPKYAYRGMTQAEAASAKTLGNIAKTTKILGYSFAGLGVLATGAQFYYSDKSGADYARLTGAGLIMGANLIPFAGPFISIGLGVLDTYGVFEPI